MEVTVREARESLSKLLDAVARGEEVTITRNGKAAARLTRPFVGFTPERIEELRKFRESLKGKVKGKPLSQIIREMRDEERF